MGRLKRTCVTEIWWWHIKRKKKTNIYIIIFISLLHCKSRPRWGKTGPKILESRCWHWLVISTLCPPCSVFASSGCSIKSSWWRHRAAAPSEQTCTTVTESSAICAPPGYLNRTRGLIMMMKKMMMMVMIRPINSSWPAVFERAVTA